MTGHKRQAPAARSLSADGGSECGCEALQQPSAPFTSTSLARTPWSPEALADHSAEWHAGFEAAICALADDPAGQLLAMFEVIGKRAAKPNFRGCMFVNAAADLPDRRHPAHAVASHHKHALLELIVQRTAQLGVANPEGLARQLKLLLEGAVATALVDPGPQPARDARDAAATLLAAEGIGEKDRADA